MVWVFAFAVFGCPILFFLERGIYYVWRLYLLGHGEHATAVLDEIVKGRKKLPSRYENSLNCWVYTVYVHVTYQGEAFREKIKLSVMSRIIGFARDYEIPVIVSRSKRGKLWIFQREETDRAMFVIYVVFFGICELLWLVLIVYPLLLHFTELGKYLAGQ